jgi:hypothetical protein
MTASAHRYPSQALMGDYARAAIGLAACGAIAAMVPFASFAFFLFFAGLLLFLAFALRTASRHRAIVELDAEGLTLTDWRPRRLAWNDITALRVKYFSTRGDRSSGWMEMTVRSPSATLRIDSAIDEFAMIARAATDAARAKGVALDETTRVNLGHLGIVIDA